MILFVDSYSVVRNGIKLVLEFAISRLEVKVAMRPIQ